MHDVIENSFSCFIYLNLGICLSVLILMQAYGASGSLM